MRRLLNSALTVLGIILGLSLLTIPAASAGGRHKGTQIFTATLKGYEEVPSVATFASGFLTIEVDPAAETISYKLSFENLQGSVTQSHIHFGQMGVSGGISLWLCQTTGTPAPTAVAAITPMCPDGGGAVSGMLTAANVVGPANQLIAAGEMDEIISAIQAGLAYGNVHSSAVPGGEIRGQLR